MEGWNEFDKRNMGTASLPSLTGFQVGQTAQPLNVGLRSPVAYQCQPGYHRYYSLEPIGNENTGEVLIVSICSQCGHALEYRTKVSR